MERTLPKFLLDAIGLPRNPIFSGVRASQSPLQQRSDARRFPLDHHNPDGMPGTTHRHAQLRHHR